MILFHPSTPQARRDAPLPELRSRLQRILNIAHVGRSASWRARVGEKVHRLRFSLGYGLVGNHFEPSVILTV